MLRNVKAKKHVDGLDSTVCRICIVGLRVFLISEKRRFYYITQTVFMVTNLLEMKTKMTKCKL